MLVTFRCNAYANIPFFSNVAHKLIALMGHSITVPGALKAVEVPEALANLEKAIAKQQEPIKKIDEENECQINLSIRALPLINLLQAAIKNNSDVMWE